ncbi:amino acid adenylation domain-containing protein [Robbsia sp. Bb-Pol-6]|uniref:Amino acid adenylation domain-containing protein n=1 Tax=Robbsia betulipollinis TaxID=2981849 RepID=A0ABT3ZJ27_9BURK|nr:non-ribosomal peptide synthetase [Robbsia betulipollinis]MCY0386511.1 amino acid adenylation domain-containing protein [Robbsia betulipollinis]
MEKDTARRIAERFSELTPDKRRLFWEKMTQQGVSCSQLPIVRRHRPAGVGTPASHAQQRQWFLWQLAPHSSAYHIAGGLWLTGTVDAPALRASLEAIVARHEVLRTRFVANEAGRVEQWIDAAGRLDWREARLAPTQIEPVTRAWADTPFDLEQGPLLRAALHHETSAAGAGGRCLLALALHHIVADGWSIQVLLEELVAHYRAALAGGAPCVAALPVQYADYAAWQRDWLEAGEQTRQLAYWRATLGETHPVLALPTDAPRQARASYRAARHRVRLPAGLSQALRARAQASSATPFMVLLAAFQALLHRYTGQDDIRVGVPVANRHRVETEPLIGFFVNTQVLRARVTGHDTLGTLLERAREATLGAQAHQDLPFDVLVDALRPERSLDHTPLFQVMFNHQRSDWRALDGLPGLGVERHALPDAAAPYELTLNVVEDAAGACDVELIYARELFEATTMARFATHYLNMLAAFSHDTMQCAGDVELLDAAQREQLRAWSTFAARQDDADRDIAQQDAVPAPAQALVHEVFAARAAQTPTALAVIHGDARWDYRTLDAAANRLAARLRRAGVGPEVRVGLALSRSPALVVALLAVLKAGGAYVPLDPAYPTERLALMLAESGAPLLLTDAAARPRLPTSTTVRVLEIDTRDIAAAAPNDPACDPAYDPAYDPACDPSHAATPKTRADNLAYIVHTSGSTGRPKGVAVPHGALARHCTAIGARYGITAQDRCLHFASIGFDAAAEQLLMPLMHGAALLLRDDEVWSVQRLTQEIRTHGITVLDLPPAYADAFAREVAPGAVNVRVCIVGGEAWSAAGFEAVRTRLAAQRAFNAYGPSEAVITPTVWEARDDAANAALTVMPIGRPVGTRTAWVLDARLNLVPPGVPGELHLGGLELARGYLDQPAQSAERFVPDPFSRVPGARLYRTGDIVRWRADGELLYLGRQDQQVKIRGFRIEPGEVEARLRAQPGVSGAIVMVVEGPGARRLVAYATALPGVVASVSSLRAALAAVLPDYMVPCAIVLLDDWPLGPNGKVDRRALPVPDAAPPVDDAGPQGAVEAQLAAIWQRLLRRERIGRHDNFFELGGDSIMSLQIVAQARRAGLSVSAREIFEQQTIAQLAACATPLESNAPTGYGVDEPIDRAAPVPLLPIQAWFFAEPFPDRHHWNQSVLLHLDAAPDVAALEYALREVIAHHPALQLRFAPDCALPGGAGWRQYHAAASPASPASASDASLLPLLADVAPEEIDAHCDVAQRGLDLTQGPVIRALALAVSDGSWRLFIAAHHLVVDTVSWRILLDDVQQVYLRRRAGAAASLPAPTLSYQAFGRQLQRAARSPALAADAAYWRATGALDAALPARAVGNAAPSARQIDAPVDAPVHATVRLDRDTTHRLQLSGARAYRLALVDVLLAATGRALCRFAERAELRIDLEGHGRESHFGPADLSRTVGWFTTVYPFRLAAMGDIGAALKRVKEARRAVPHGGMSFGMLKYLGTAAQREALADVGHAEVLFNYLGQLDRMTADAAGMSATASATAPATASATAPAAARDIWRLADETGGAASSARNRATHVLDIAAQVRDGALSLTLAHPRGDRYGSAELAALAADLRAELSGILAHCESGASGLTPSDVPLAGLDQAQLDALPIPFETVQDLYPLSPMQTGIVFQSLLGRQSGAYVNQLRVDIDRLDAARFVAAWESAASRHDALRTGFLMLDDAPRQWVTRAVSLPLRAEDWRAADPGTREARLERFAADQLAQPFDLARPPLWRVALLRTGAARHHFVWTFHHALIDGWSAAQLLAEVLATYEGRAPTEPAGRYRAFIAHLASGAGAASEAWWREQVALLDGPTLLGAALPPARTAHGKTNTPAKKGADEAAHTHGTVSLAWNAARTAALSRFAQSHHVTLNTLVQAAWLILLQRYTGQRTVTFGATVAGRPETLAGVERMVGLFINTIPVIGAPQPSLSVAAWLARLQQAGVAAREHEHVALYDIQRWAGLEGGQALFDSLLVFENYPVDEILSATGTRDLHFSGLRNEDRTSYALTLSITHAQAGGPGQHQHRAARGDAAQAESGSLASGEARLRIAFDYTRDTFDAPQIERIAAQLSMLLDAFVAHPQATLGSLDMLPDAERALLARWGRGVDVPVAPDVCTRIAAQAALRPHRQAVVLDGASLDYRTLECRAARVADALRAAGVGADDRVGIAMARSLDMIVAVLGVLKAGGAYVPLDPSYPDERLAFMIQDSGMKWALTADADATNGRDGTRSTDATGTHRGTGTTARAAFARLGVTTLDVTAIAQTRTAAPAGETDEGPHPPHPQQLAYLIYTSGSTGQPKGVGITHDALARHTDFGIGWFDVTSDDRVLQFSTFNFDGFIEQVFPTLCVGATLVLRGPDLWSSAQFQAELARERITVADLTTAYWHALAQDFAGQPGARQACATLRRVHAGGEAMPADAVRAWHAAGLGHITLVNTYGPSEATVTATAFDCTPNGTAGTAGTAAASMWPGGVPLGRPLGGRTVCVLDAQSNLAPMGAVGELCIGGALLARGYHDRPGLTASRFIADPRAAAAPDVIAGARLYRTGDIVRWREDGELLYLGRNDHQVKIRGFRIEPGEIEACLLHQPEVREAAVVTRAASGGLRLLAYVSLARDRSGGAAADAATTLRTRVAERLPDYMVPSAVIVLDALPLNPNGKIDRHALPEPVDPPAPSDPATRPQGEIETTLAAIWEQVLATSPVGRTDRFFALGGHSLAAMQVQSAIRTRLGCDAPLADLMSNQPLHALADTLRALRPAAAQDAVMADEMRDILAQL